MYKVLKLLREAIELISAQYFLTTKEVDPKEEGVKRIEALARLSNRALWPSLMDHREDYSANDTVVFTNDVATCMETHSSTFQTTVAGIWREASSGIILMLFRHRRLEGHSKPSRAGTAPPLSQ